MAVTIFTVRATIDAEKEDAFNDWYNNKHVPEVLQFNGAISARRYKRIMGDEKYQYVAVYEFASQEVFEKFMASDNLKALKADYNAHWDDVSEREGFGYVQVWP